MRNILTSLILTIGTLKGESAIAPEAEAIAATVNQFHAALLRGDRTAALDLLAPDAVILESGGLQTREEYAREHLGEDIAFVKAIPGIRSNAFTKQEGNVAWTTATTKSIGKYNGRDVNSVGVELMVLMKTASGWHISAIHWSSHRG